MAKKTKNKDIVKAAMPKSKPDVINKDIMDMVDFKNYEKEKGELHPEDPRAGDNMDTGKAFYEEGDKTLESEIERLTKLAKERKKFLGKEINAAKGGSMTKQMEMFEEGGLKDEGGTVDEASGNDVPIGSTKEEVRDDIPAQLSEGEFVFPADVVRFIGLEKLMQMRQKAKMGLKKMEAMGQMGNSDEATMPDDMPFSMDDLDMEDEEDTQSNFNRGGVVTMAIGGTTPTTENTSQNINVTMNESNLNPKQTSVPIRTDSTPIVQQRTTTQQKPLNIRQEAVPIRGQVTNIPSSADFLKKKSSDVTPTYDLEGAIPSNIGSRFTTSKAETQQKQDVQSVKNEIDAITSMTFSDEGDDSDSTSSVAQGGIDYASVDRFALDDDLRDVFNDFSKSQLSMFGVVTSSPFGLAVSGIGLELGKATGGKSVQGAVASAELGKAKATAFHQTALGIQKEYGLTREPNINNWSIEAKNALAQQGPIALNFAQDIFNATYGIEERTFTTPSEKSFMDSVKDKASSFMSAIDNIGKPQIDIEKQDPIAQQNMKQSLIDMQKSIADLAKQSLAEKAKADKELDDVLSGDPLGDEDKTTVELTSLGFNNNAMSDIEANGGSKGTGTNSNGTSYSINVNGTFTHSNGTTVNFTDSKGNPGNAPSTPTPSAPPAPPPSRPSPSYNNNDNNDNGGNDGTDGGYGGSDNTTDYGGT